jgi:peroxiredoxin Q/BCP
MLITKGTTQACLFRDSYAPLTATGFSIYGLSTDSPKANTTFKEKQKLPYSLLCDPQATLTAAIGMKKPPKSTTRGVLVVDKSGKVLAAEPGGPAATVEVVKKLVASSGTSVPATGDGIKAAEAEGEKPLEEPRVEKPIVTEPAVTAPAVTAPAVTAPAVTEPTIVEPTAATNGINGSATHEDVAKANVAADVADTAEKLDSKEPIPAPAEHVPQHSIPQHSIV